MKDNRKENTFIIIDNNRTMIYDSRVGFLDLKALSLKDKLESEDKNKLIAYIKPLMINSTDRNTIKHDNYQFYFSKLLSLKGIKKQNDVLTKEMIRAVGFSLASFILGIIGTSFMIYNYMNPYTTVRTAAHVATDASHLLNRTSTLLNYAWGTKTGRSYGTSSNSDDRNQGRDGVFGSPTCFVDQGTCFADQDQGQELEPEEYIDLRSSYTDRRSCLVYHGQSPFTDEETGILNKEGQNDLNRLYVSN